MAGIIFFLILNALFYIKINNIFNLNKDKTSKKQLKNKYLVIA